MPLKDGLSGHYIYAMIVIVGTGRQGLPPLASVGAGRLGQYQRMTPFILSIFHQPRLNRRGTHTAKEEGRFKSGSRTILSGALYHGRAPDS